MLDTFMMLIAAVFVRSRLASIDITEVFGSFSSWGGILPVPDRFEQVHFMPALSHFHLQKSG